MKTLTAHIQALPHYGEKVAIIYQTAFRTFRWSYQDLYRDVQKTARFLGDLGVERGDGVVLWAPNSPQWIMLFLATLYRGAVAVPADVGAAPGLVAKITRETEAKVLFRSRLHEPPQVDVPVLLVEDLLDDIEHRPPQETPTSVEEDDIAQVLYTSGTTGTPKGVVLTHRNIAANLRSLEQAVPIGADHVLISVLPLSHAFEQSAGFWAALTHGATVVYLQVLKASELFRALQRYPVTVLVVVPLLLSLIQSHIERQVGGGLRAKAFHALLRLADNLPWGVRRYLFFPVHARIGRAFRFFVVGGAPLRPEVEQFWNRMGFLVLQGYGLTEAAPIVTVNRFDARKLGSAGLPLPGVEVASADDREVLVRGENITPGYFKDPQRTAETITDGWLHTGDLGYLDADGFLFLRGRKKDLIVTPAGLNVYPEDVEVVFQRLPGVRDVAVMEFHNRVHAVLLLEPGTDPQAVVEQGNSALASYQRVRGYTVWPEEDFPRTTTRKPKKHELRAALERTEKGEAPVGPRPEEHQPSEILRILAHVSGKPTSTLTPEARIGVDLGLDSVGRIELVGLLEERLNAEVAEEDITEETRVQDLARLVRQGAGARRRFARWALTPAARAARRVLLQGLVFPLYNRVVRQQEGGLEHREGLEGPVIFAPNHTSHLDTIAVYKALPSRFRDRLAVAAFAEFFEVSPRRLHLWLWRRFLYYIFTLLFNTYPLPRERGFRRSLQYTGELLDNGWSVLVFPEGRQSHTGEIQPFREGIGVMAGEMRVLVVPLHIHGLFEVLPRGRHFIQRRGRAVVRFGKPLRFRKESFADFTHRLEAAVRNLGAPEQRGRTG